MANSDYDSATAVDTQADSTVSDALLQVASLHIGEEVSNRATGSDSATDGPLEAIADSQGAQEIQAWHARAEESSPHPCPSLTAYNLACCMYSIEMLPHVAVTARLLSGARVCLAGICQAPSRPLMTWPGNFAVRAAFADTDWVVEVCEPSDKFLCWGGMYTITNGIETTCVRMLDRRPDSIILLNGTCVSIANVDDELCIGQGAISLVGGQPTVVQSAEVTVIKRGSAAHSSN